MDRHPVWQATVLRPTPVRLNGPTVVRPNTSGGGRTARRRLPSATRVRRLAAVLTGQVRGEFPRLQLAYIAVATLRLHPHSIAPYRLQAKVGLAVLAVLGCKRPSGSR
jgi:hypothetical protein